MFLSLGVGFLLILLLLLLEIRDTCAQDFSEEELEVFTLVTQAWSRPTMTGFFSLKSSAWHYYMHAFDILQFRDLSFYNIYKFLAQGLFEACSDYT